MLSRLPAGYGRGSLVAVLAAAHASVIALVMLESPTTAVARSPAIAVSEIREAAPVVPTVEPKFAQLAVSIDEPKFDVASDAAPAILASAPSSGECAVGDDVQAVLRASAEVHVALDRMPRAARSVADAVLLWNGRWIDASAVGGHAAIDPIRTAVAAVVHAAPPLCRVEKVTGPRFMVLPSPLGDRVVTFGSGQWTWAEVAADTATA